MVSRATGLANDGDKGDVTTTVRLRQAFRSIFLHMPDFVQRRFLLTKHLLNTPLFILSPLFLHSFPPHSHSNFYASPTVELLWKFTHVGNLPTPRQNSITVFLSLAILLYSQTAQPSPPGISAFPFPTNLHYSQTHHLAHGTAAGFRSLRIYTTLKPDTLGFRSLRIYTTLKLMFNGQSIPSLFPFPTNLHYSQTEIGGLRGRRWFPFPTNLHYSQTPPTGQSCG